LRLGANHAAPETEYNIYSGKKSVIPSTSDLFIPSYLSQTGHVVPVRHLYPISRDHLLPLVEYNIFRGCTTNVLILGYLHLIGSSCRFGDSVPVFPNPYQLSLTHIDLDSESVSSRRFNVPHQSSNIPISLKPTLLQQSTLYPDWIAILPCPRMRDNAIRTQYLFTNSELCADILDGLMGKQNDVGAGAAVWSSPWEPSGWELTEGFIRKGGFLVQGYTDLFESTNRWRDLRGEEPLAQELKYNIYFS
jgi:Domain of unknown function (DUF3425)